MVSETAMGPKRKITTLSKCHRHRLRKRKEALILNDWLKTKKRPNNSKKLNFVNIAGSDSTENNKRIINKQQNSVINCSDRNSKMTENLFSNNYSRGICNLSAKKKVYSEFESEPSMETEATPVNEIPNNLVTNDSFIDLENIQINSSVSPNNVFRNELACWAAACNIPHSHVASLLKILNKWHPEDNLCKDPRTLLKTTRSTITYDVAPGKYIHFGIEREIISYIETSSNVSKIAIQIACDGVPIYASKKSALWPVLGRIMPTKHVFIIGCFYGQYKASDCNNYMKFLVDDMNSAMQNGITVNGVTVSVELHSMIFDLPARSMIMKTKGHTGYLCCLKCTVPGEYRGNVCFPGINFVKRTNQSFRQQDDKNLHKGLSVLLEMENFDPTKHVPEDPMHLIYIGVMNRLFLLWKTGPLPYRFLTKVNSNLLSEYLNSVGSYVPEEFPRKPRGIDDLCHWKATEFRFFLNYCGPIALLRVLTEVDEVYKHFLELHVAVRLLCSEFDENVLQFCTALFQKFVINVEKLFGPENVTRNVHGLLHIADDARNLGRLEDFSAFRFENVMRFIKKLIRSPNLPLEQIYRRLGELNNLDLKFSHMLREKTIGLHERHFNGPLMKDSCGIQYKVYKFENFVLNLKSSDNCCKIGNDIVLIKNFIAVSNEEIKIVGCRFEMVEELYEYPCKSSILNIFKVKKLSRFIIYDLKDISMKFVRLPFLKEKNCYAIFPLLHLS